MKIRVNGKEVETSAKNLLELSVELALPEVGVAVAVNNKMVTRVVWVDYKLNPDDSVVIIKAACGG